MTTQYGPAREWRGASVSGDLLHCSICDTFFRKGERHACAPKTDNQFGQAYYAAGGMEAIDVIEAFAAGNVHRSHALKYLLRAGKKGPAREDLQKALWWINRELSRLDK